MVTKKSLKNLIPLNKRSKKDAKKIQRQGGHATKGITKFKITTCKSCKLKCPLKQKGIEQEWRCKLPDAKRLVLEAANDPTKLIQSLYYTLGEIDLGAKTVKEKREAFKSKLELKKELHPNPDNKPGITIDNRSIIVSSEEVESKIKKLLKMK